MSGKEDTMTDIFPFKSHISAQVILSEILQILKSATTLPVLLIGPYFQPQCLNYCAGISLVILITAVCLIGQASRFYTFDQFAAEYVKPASAKTKTNYITFLAAWKRDCVLVLLDL